MLHSLANELIFIMADKDSIRDEVRREKYYSISVDSTVDQISVTIRYILPNSDPVEIFLCFIPIRSHTGKAIAETVLIFRGTTNPNS